MAGVVGSQGRLVSDGSKQDGTPRKLMSVNRLASIGWKYSTSLRAGLGSTYQWYSKMSKGLGSD